jgi:hypothetical protein
MTIAVLECNRVIEELSWGPIHVVQPATRTTRQLKFCAARYADHLLMKQGMRERD